MDTYASAATKRKPTKWEIVVHLVDHKTEEVRPENPWPKGIVVGDKVKFRSPDGKVKVEFKAIDPPDKHPFGAKEYEGAEEFHTVLNVCPQFMVYCYIKPHGKARFLGWGPDNAKAGSRGGTGGGH